MRLYHYSKKLGKIKKDRYIRDTSFSRTNTLDVVLENFPELLLTKHGLKQFKELMKNEKRTKTYESKYPLSKIKFKNKLLNEFFNHNNYVLAFDSPLPRGWIKYKLFQLISYKIGNKFLSFNIPARMMNKIFVLNQKYWSPVYSKKVLKLNSWNPNFKIEKNPEAIKKIFGNYYLSIKRLNNYKGDFEVPEFWIPQKIPYKHCKTGKISKDLYNKFLMERKEIKKQK